MSFRQLQFSSSEKRQPEVQARIVQCLRQKSIGLSSYALYHISPMPRARKLDPIFRVFVSDYFSILLLILGSTLA
jgi:hypothetical protein